MTARKNANADKAALATSTNEADILRQIFGDEAQPKVLQQGPANFMRDLVNLIGQNITDLDSRNLVGEIVLAVGYSFLVNHGKGQVNDVIEGAPSWDNITDRLVNAGLLTQADVKRLTAEGAKEAVAA